MKPSWHSGFTLLEVMVAVAILALSLTAIFSSEAGAIKTAHRARKMTVATELARCKMNEIEEEVAERGLPSIDDSGSDVCCEHAEMDGFHCEWEVVRVVLPDEFDPSEDGEGEEGGMLGGLLGGGDDDGGGDEETGPDISKLTGGAVGGAPDSMEGFLGGVGGGMGQTQDMLSQMAFNIAFPILKPAIEEQVRRATVTVKWKEGSAEREFDVVQFLVGQPPQMQPGAGAQAGEGQDGSQEDQ